MGEFTPLGERVEEARRKRGLSQEQLARAAGVTRQHYGRVIKGAADLKLSEWEAVAGALEVRMADLLAEEPMTYANDSPPAAVVKERSSLPRSARTIVDAFKRELAQAGALPEDLAYVETILMEPHLPPALKGGRVEEEDLLKHIQGMVAALRGFFREQFGYPLKQ